MRRRWKRGASAQAVGRTADITGAVGLADHLPEARYPPADKAYDADHRRTRLKQRRILPVIPNKADRRKPHAFNRKRYRGRNVIEPMFGRLKDFRGIATRYDKKANNVMAALCLAALVCDWI